MTYHFLFEALGKIRIAGHKILNDQSALYSEFPIILLLGITFPDEIRIFVKSLAAIFPRPRKRGFVQIMVINALVDPSQNFHLVNRFHPHSKVIFKKVRLNQRAGNTHTHGTDLQV